MNIFVYIILGLCILGIVAGLLILTQGFTFNEEKALTVFRKNIKIREQYHNSPKEYAERARRAQKIIGFIIIFVSVAIMILANVL